MINTRLIYRIIDHVKPSHLLFKIHLVHAIMFLSIQREVPLDECLYIIKSICGFYDNIGTYFFILFIYSIIINVVASINIEYFT